MKDTNLLRSFTVLPLRHSNQDPYFCALLCIKHRGRIRPFVWLDNWGANPTLRRTPVPLPDPIPLESVKESIQQITGSGAGSEALHRHLLDMANVRLEEMQTALDRQGRKYASSTYADAAYAQLSRPGLGTKRVTGLMDMYMAGVQPEDSEGLEDWADMTKVLAKPATWEWGDYTEHPAMGTLLNRLLSNGKPLEYLQGDLSMWPKLKDAQRQTLKALRDNTDKRRMVTAKSRLSYVKELGYNLTHDKPFPAMRDLPFPLDAYSDRQIAQLDPDALAALLAECHTWVSLFFVMDCAHATTNGRPPQRQWSKSNIDIISMACSYSPESGKVVEGEPLIYADIQELEAVAIRYDIQYIMPTVQQVKDRNAIAKAEQDVLLAKQQAGVK